MLSPRRAPVVSLVMALALGAPSLGSTGCMGALAAARDRKDATTFVGGAVLDVAGSYALNAGVSRSTTGEPAYAPQVVLTALVVLGIDAVIVMLVK